MNDPAARPRFFQVSMSALLVAIGFIALGGYVGFDQSQRVRIVDNAFSVGAGQRSYFHETDKRKLRSEFNSILATIRTSIAPNPPMLISRIGKLAPYFFYAAANGHGKKELLEMLGPSDPDHAFKSYPITNQKFDWRIARPDCGPLYIGIRIELQSGSLLVGAEIVQQHADGSIVFNGGRAVKMAVNSSQIFTAETGEKFILMGLGLGAAVGAIFLSCWRSYVLLRWKIHNRRASS